MVNTPVLAYLQHHEFIARVALFAIRTLSELQSSAIENYKAYEAIVVPRCMVDRQPHFRFRYTAAGKQVSEATARALVEG